LIATIAALASGAPARAAGEFDAVGFAPPCDPYGVARAQGAKSLAPLSVHASATYGYALRPVSFEGSSVGAARDVEVEHDAHVLALAAGVGLLPLPRGSAAVGVALPIALRQDGLDRAPGAAGAARDGGAGDVRLDAKATLLDRDDDPLGCAARAWAFAPTGERGRFSSAGGAWRAGAEVVLETRLDWFRAGVSLGWEWLEGEFRGPSGTVDDRLTATAAALVAPLRDIAGFEHLEVGIEVRHWTVAGRPWDHEATSPLEGTGVVRFSGALFALLAAGGRWNGGLGAPDVRLEAALGTTF
jgi:hypothetical protein